jgi:hypothetical protein
LAEKNRVLCTYNPSAEEVEGLEVFLYEAAQNFELFLNIKKSKNQKSIVIDVLFKAYSMVPLSCRSNLAGRCI